MKVAECKLAPQRWWTSCSVTCDITQAGGSYWSSADDGNKKRKDVMFETSLERFLGYKGHYNKSCRLMDEYK